VTGAVAAVSWSGGKDSCLALHRAAAAGVEVRTLVTMLTEGGRRTRSHGLRVEVVEAQADALGVPLVTRATSWAGYEAAFTEALREAGAVGATAAVFGDIDLADHRSWCVRVCRNARLSALHPLWQEPRRALLDEALSLGVEGVVVAVRDGVVPRELLGRALDPGLVGELEALGIDPCGERGEYHTAVLAAPGFARRVEVRAGGSELRDGVWFLDLEPVAGG
jgi:uncharacterized protein (TIGR00290 family)